VIKPGDPWPDVEPEFPVSPEKWVEAKPTKPAKPQTA
jgi:hypothetical protein